MKTYALKVPNEGKKYFRAFFKKYFPKSKQVLPSEAEVVFFTESRLRISRPEKFNHAKIVGCGAMPDDFKDLKIDYLVNTRQLQESEPSEYFIQIMSEIML